MIMMDIKHGVLTINGHVVSGFSDDSDCLSFPEAEIATTRTGADGKKIGSRTGEMGGPVTIKLLPNSPTCSFLGKLAKQIDNGVPIIFNAQWNNPVAGEFIQCINGTLTVYPRGTTYGKGDAANKNYTIDFEQIKESPEASLLSNVVGVASAVTAI